MWGQFLYCWCEIGETRHKLRICGDRVKAFFSFFVGNLQFAGSELSITYGKTLDFY